MNGNGVQLTDLLLLAALSFALTALAGLLILPRLRALHLGARERSDGPQSHLKKSGTPLMGGLFMLVGLLLASLYVAYRSAAVLPYTLTLVLILLFAAIGLIDDYTKTKLKQEGLSVRQKTIVMLLAAVLYIIYIMQTKLGSFYLPLAQTPLAQPLWFQIVMGIVLLILFFFISNSVNLTDGVDGLCASVSFIVFCCYAAIAWKIGLDANAVLAAFNLSVILAAACLAFLLFNWHPAKVFMGDTGSLALGAAVAAIPLLLGRPWLLLIVGLLYCLEGLSTVLQVGYYKLSHGQRLFRMAPLHHHFELGGWSELKVVLLFSLFTLLTAVLAYYLV